MTEFEEIQKDFAKYIKKHGVDKVPLHDPALLPLLRILWRAHEESDAMLVAFDFNSDTPQKLYHGLMVPIPAAQEVANWIVETVSNDPEMVALAQARGVKTSLTMTLQNGMALLYHDDLYVPMAALGKRRN